MNSSEALWLLPLPLLLLMDGFVIAVEWGYLPVRKTRNKSQQKCSMFYNKCSSSCTCSSIEWVCDHVLCANLAYVVPLLCATRLRVGYSVISEIYLCINVLFYNFYNYDEDDNDAWDAAAIKTVLIYVMTSALSSADPLTIMWSSMYGRRKLVSIWSRLATLRNASTQSPITNRHREPRLRKSANTHCEYGMPG